MGRKSDFGTLEIIVAALIDMQLSSRYLNKKEFIKIIAERAKVSKGAIYKSLATLEQSGILNDKNRLIYGLDARNRHISRLEIDTVQVWDRTVELEIKNFEKREDVSKLPPDIRIEIVKYKKNTLNLWHTMEISETAMILKHIDKMYLEGKNPPDSLSDYMFNNDKEAVMTYLKMWKEQ